jgi:hypothetical protein
MTATLATALLTALLSSAVTLGLGYLALRRWWLPRIEAEVEARYRAHLAEALDRLGEVVQERVRRGVVEGAAELSSPEGLRGTAESVAGSLGKVGAELLARGLGGRRRER